MRLAASSGRNLHPLIVRAHGAREDFAVMSDRRFYRHHRRRRSQPDVAGIVAFLLFGVGLIAIPALMTSNESTKSVGHSHHARAPLPRYLLATETDIRPLGGSEDL